MKNNFTLYKIKMDLEIGEVENQRIWYRMTPSRK